MLLLLLVLLLDDKLFLPEPLPDFSKPLTAIPQSAGKEGDGGWLRGPDQVVEVSLQAAERGGRPKDSATLREKSWMWLAVV